MHNVHAKNAGPDRGLFKKSGNKEVSLLILIDLLKLF